MFRRTLAYSILLVLLAAQLVSFSSAATRLTAPAFAHPRGLHHTSHLLPRLPLSHSQSTPLIMSAEANSNTNTPDINKLASVRGGETGDKDIDAKHWSMRGSLARNLLGLWGVAQVVSTMANAIKRLVPIALQPFKQNDLQPAHWAMYAAWCLVMAYTEGYKAFQLKFAPMVVSRAFDLVNKPSIINVVLAGPYSMGMFNAPRKRMIVSWLVMAGVFSLVKIVKFLPYPYRSIVDGGVVVGLSYGTLSIIALSVKALFGGKVVDPDSQSANKEQ